MIRLQDQLTNERLGVTMMIQKRFPERYHLLGETPLFLFENGKGVYVVDFEQFIDPITTH